LAGLRGEESIASLCRQEGISESLYYIIDGFENPTGGSFHPQTKSRVWLGSRFHAEWQQARDMY
jgi:transposase-like protein